MNLKIITLLATFPIITTFVVLNNDVEEKTQTVYIQKLGDVDSSDLNMVVDIITDFYDFDVIVNGDLPLVDSLKVKGTKRIQSNKLLLHSNKINSNLEGKVLVLTKYDICTDRTLNGKTYKNWGIFGLAGINKQSTVVSTFRMTKNHDVRLEKVTIHELGHTLGLRHCDYDERCVMNDAKGKGSNLDGTKLMLCDKCKEKINQI